MAQRRARSNEIRIMGAREHNLADVSLAIPRRRITAFTGVSGSGKTSLVFDTIAAEAQRELNETFNAFVRNRLPDYGRPDVDAIDGLSPVVVINQKRLGGGARSTVGTITDIYALLRLLFSRASKPYVGESSAFSFNDSSGMCTTCAGLGVVVTADPQSFVDTNKSMAEGAVLLPGFGNQPGNKRYWYRQWAESGFFDPGVPLKDWTADERTALLRGGAAVERVRRKAPKDYESLLEHFNRIYINAEGEMSAHKKAALERFTTSKTCPDCRGDRLNERSRTAKVAGHTIVQCSSLEITDLIGVIESVDHEPSRPVAEDLLTMLRATDDIGLGYLNLARQTSTLSGGESQRIKMVRHLGSSLTEMLYVFDEPSIGLHPADIDRLTALLQRLRDKGNTVLVVEHDPDVIAIADHVVDLGPGAGTGGGELQFEGTYAQLRRSSTATGKAIRQRRRLRGEVRDPGGWLSISNADRNNLEDVNVDVPSGVLTVLTGVAGSGKSSLLADLLEQHPGAVVVDQSAVSTSRRSNVATYVDIANPIRRIFANANDVSASLFSANSKGACPECKGLGVVYTDLAFMSGFTSTCKVCHGRRFTDKTLGYTVDGYSIADVLDLTVTDAAGIAGDRTIQPVLAALEEVGLGYLTLGQPLNSLSGGECQRLKFGVELHRSARDALYVLDEPTTGLHLADTERLLGIVDRLVDAGNTVVVVEHNLDVIRHADWIIDLGPGAGHHGGRLLFTGPPADLAGNRTSITAQYLFELSTRP